MSAEVLRRAAALMRARAEAATSGPRYPLSEDYEVVGDSPVSLDPEGDDYETASMDFLPNREHIASWHPAVALAVADLLDMEAEWAERDEHNTYAVAVARAYLGESA